MQDPVLINKTVIVPALIADPKCVNPGVLARFKAHDPRFLLLMRAPFIPFNGYVASHAAAGAN